MSYYTILVLLHMQLPNKPGSMTLSFSGIICVWFTCVDIRNGSGDDLPSSDNVNTATPPMSMEGTLVYLLRKLVEKRREGNRPEELSVSVDVCANFS